MDGMLERWRTGWFPERPLRSLGIQGDPSAVAGTRTRRAAFVAITTNQFKNGNHIEVEGTVFKILEFQHVKPGKGGAFVRTKLRRASDGGVIDRTFRAGA